MENIFCYVALFLSIFLLIKLLVKQTKNLPASPFALPIIGHLHLLKHPLHRTLETLSLQYGPILSLKLGCRSVLIVSSPSAVEECFTKNDAVFANRPKSMVGDLMTYNYTAFVWTPYGHHWRSLRRLSVTEIFSQNSLQKSAGIREEEILTLLRQVFRVSGSGTQKVDLKYLFSLLTFNITMRMVAGKQCIEEDAARMDVGRQYLTELRKMFLPSMSINVCDFLPILRWVGNKDLEKSMIKIHRRRNEFLQGLIDET